MAEATLFRNTAFVLSADAEDGDLGLIERGAVLVREGLVEWVGPEAELSTERISAARSVDLEGRLLSPGLVDCHAHPLFAGRRADEFARRARGEHYQDIAAAGGGIQATTGPTRSAATEELVELCLGRLDRALRWGTTTMEAKSGYDLTVEGELRLLEVARRASEAHAIELMPTLLGAHVIPKEYADCREDYVTAVCEQMIPRAAEDGLCRAVDVYCDEGAYTLEETRRILMAAKAHGLDTKAHIGQFADLGGAQLLAELGSLSGDHLEQVSDEGIAAMARAGVVATMLPGACVQLKMTPPPVEKLRAAGVSMALASDLNPGTANSETLPVPMWLATTHYGMSVEEAWLGVTRIAARALGRQDIGRIAVGCKADLVAWDAELPADVPYHFAVNLVHQVWKLGAAQLPA